MSASTHELNNIRFGRHGNCLILVHNQNSPTDEEWRQWVSYALLQSGPNASAECKVLVVSAGGSPTFEQRGLLRETMPTANGGMKTAVVIGSGMGRAVADTMGRFKRRLTAFQPGEISKALDYLELSGLERLEVVRQVRYLHNEMGLPCDISL